MFQKLNCLHRKVLDWGNTHQKKIFSDVSRFQKWGFRIILILTSEYFAKSAKVRAISQQ